MTSNFASLTKEYKYEDSMVGDNIFLYARKSLKTNGLDKCRNINIKTLMTTATKITDYAEDSKKRFTLMGVAFTTLIVIILGVLVVFLRAAACANILGDRNSCD